MKHEAAQKRGPEAVVPTTNIKRTAGTDSSRRGGTVTGRVVVDLTGLKRWTDEGDRETRGRLQALRDLPPGVTVLFRPGEILPSPIHFSDVRLDHVHVVVESGDPHLIRRWIGALRGDLPVIA